MGLSLPQITSLPFSSIHFPSAPQHFHSYTLTFPSWEPGGNGGPRNVNERPLKAVRVRRYAAFKRQAERVSGSAFLGSELSGSCWVFSCVWCILNLGPFHYGCSIKRPLWGWVSSSPNSSHWSHCLIEFSTETPKNFILFPKRLMFSNGGIKENYNLYMSLQNNSTCVAQIRHQVVNLRQIRHMCVMSITVID